MADIRPGDVSICPRCGNGGTPIMDIDEILPMLDEIGYPMYYCRTCACPFTGLTRPDEPMPEKLVVKFNGLVPPLK